MPIYSDISRSINERPFRLLVPENYEPNLPSYYTENGIPPIFNSDSTDMCVSMLTIAHIVDMHFNKVSFAIAKPEDVETILSLMEGYIAQMEPFAKDRPDVFLTNLKAAYLDIKREYGKVRTHLEQQDPSLKRPESIVDLLKLTENR